MIASAYRPQPSTLALLKAKIARAVDTPCSIIASNCSSWPGRASCAVSVQVIASKVKSSICALESALGFEVVITNSPRSPVLPISRGGLMCGAGTAADSAVLARRMTAARSGSVMSLLFADDGLDRREPLAVERAAAGRSGCAVFLQLPQHVAIVVRLPAVLPRDHYRQRLHLVARLGEGEQRPVHQLVRVHGDAVLLEVVGVDLRRQQVGLACARQHGCAHPLAVGIDLRGQRGKVLLPALQSALLEAARGCRSGTRPGSSAPARPPPTTVR